jgi:response regulator of citrate/malate metabolism
MIELSDRFRGISQDESVVMAGFFAGLTGPTREQLRQNARELARDILAEGAAQYVNLPKSEQAKFLDGWLVEWTKTAERMATGKVDDKSDQQRLDEMKGQAKRDSTRERNPDRLGSLTEGSASRFLDFWSSDVETAASPRQQGQITRFMTDLRTHMTK